jgi:hypothetical protein
MEVTVNPTEYEGEAVVILDENINQYTVDYNSIKINGEKIEDEEAARMAIKSAFENPEDYGL